MHPIPVRLAARLPARGRPRPAPILRLRSRWRRHWAGWTAACCVLSLAACAEGYPSEDVAPIDPARMSQAELLSALNDLGKEPHLDRRWRYALRPNCELEVSVRGGAGPQGRVALDGAEVSTRAVENRSEIRLVPKGGDDAQALTVLASRRWSDTVRARSLLTHLELRCLRAPDGAA